MKDAPAALRPFIQVIDHYDNNEKLGIGFEAKVKKGSLLVLAVDTQKTSTNVLPPSNCWKALTAT